MKEFDWCKEFAWERVEVASAGIIAHTKGVVKEEEQEEAEWGNLIQDSLVRGVQMNK